MSHLPLLLFKNIFKGFDLFKRRKMDRDFVLFIYTNKTSSLIRMASIQSGLTTKINLEVFPRNYQLKNEPLLHAIQMAKLFPDSKSFVDMKQRFPLEEVKKAFNDLEDHSKENLELFVEENFVNEEDTLLQYVPDDWSPFEPKDIIKSFNNYPEYSGFISEINNRMKSLCRKIDEDVLLNQQLYSLIYLPNPVIIPGGRFKEIYYWDSYWIIKGLLVCGMNTTVKGILENFLYMVKLFGHVPNGGRTYYIGRSQPPLLILMVKDYMDQTQDYDFVKENISILRNEFEYWVNKHLVLVEDDRGQMRKLFRFIDEDSTPRPESYFEDFDLVSSLELLPEKQKDLFRQLRTAAETGWDFSTRWYINENGTNEGELKDTKADQILPVDLNSFLCYNAQILSNFYRDILLDESTADDFQILSMEILEAIDAILWNPSSGIWFDYDFMNKKSRNYFYPSNLTPLFLISDITSKIIDQSKIESALNYILEMDNEEIHPGGLPSSLIPSPQQWDFPNCWCPLEHIVVMGLLKIGTESAYNKALSIAKRRINSAFLNFEASSGNIYEKYDATDPKSTGHGGEYLVQIGFGWTNGVILDFFKIFGEKLIENVAPKEL